MPLLAPPATMIIEVVANAHCVRGGDGLDGGFPGMAGAMQPPAFCQR